MHRRDALRTMAAGAVAAALVNNLSAAEPPARRTGMGLVVYCQSHQQRAFKRSNPQANLFEPLTFLEHCRGLGGGGIQVPLGVRDDTYAERLRDRAADYGMYVEGIVSPPFSDAAIGEFEAQVKTAARAGAAAVRTVILPGRRYEFFDSLEKFREFEARGRQALQRAIPIVEKHRVRLALENHKNHRIAERVALLKDIDSEYVGACVDTGNNLALLEDPVDLAKALAPWALTVHLKDQAVAEYEDGFLLADVPLGQGCINLKTVVGVLRETKPNIHFGLELITRDALKVPCLTERYWATFPELPARDLARTLGLARNGDAKTLPQVSSLSPEEQVALEKSNVEVSIIYAREELEI